MFEQMEDFTARKTSWKERVTEGTIILAVIAVAVGLVFYALNV